MGKLIGGIQMEGHLEPICLSYINGCALLIVGCSKGDIFVVEFKTRDGVLDFELIFKISLFS